MSKKTGRQLSFLPDSPDEDGDQLDLIEEAGTETIGPVTFADRAYARVVCRHCEGIGGSHLMGCTRPRRPLPDDRATARRSR